MPDWKPAIRKQLADLQIDPARELEIVEEVSQHLDDQFEELLSQGHVPEQAKHLVLTELTSGHIFAETLRKTGLRKLPEPVVLGADRRNYIENFFQDLRYAARMLRKNPVFTAIAVITLALGIGANTALFTAVDTVMFRPLPAREPNRLVFVAKAGETFSFPFYERLRDGFKSLDGFAASQYRAPRRELSVSGASNPSEIFTQGVTGNFFSVLGMPPLLGRTFAQDDDRKGAAQPVVVISHSFWIQRFAADPDIVGRNVHLDKVPVTIIGVMPPDFIGFEADVKPDLWWPLQLVSQLEPERSPMGEGVSWLVLFGRLRDGATLQQAHAEASVFFRRELESEVARNPNRPSAERERILSRTIEVLSGRAGFVGARGEFQQPLIILMAAVAVVLLIACSNIAGLLLARGAARQRELAVRVALGARHGRIVCQLITESVLLALLGGAAGLIFARAGAAFLSNFIAQSNTPVLLAPDIRALLFTLGVSTLVGVLFGLAPAWSSRRLDLATAIKNQTNATAGISLGRFLPILVVAQVALSVLLLAGAGLFVRTLQKLRALDFGFQGENLVCLSIDPGRARRQPGEQEMLLRTLLAELPTVPGIRNASLGGAGILTGNGIIMDVAVEGYSPPPDEEMRTSAVLAGPGFFETLRVPILRGRPFAPTDEPPPGLAAQSTHATVAIIGEAMARRFFGDVDPVGKRFTVDSSPKITLEIVGVAGDTRYSPNLRSPVPLQFYIPYFGSGIRMPPTFYLRSDQPVAGLSSSIREVLTRVGSELKIKDLRAMDGVIDRLLLRERIIAQLVTFFSAFALLLACLGIYGILSFRVVQRTREIGLRMALGATLAGVIRLVINQGLKLVVIGVVIGVAVALLATRFLTALLYGVTPADPVTFAGVTALLLTAATLAAWLPARRAAKVDPMVALRCE